MLRSITALVLVVAVASPAAADFTPPGLWDPLPLDTSVRPPANIGAAIASAKAVVNARRQGDKTTSEPVSGVQEGCSLQIASATLPQGASNHTIVLQSEIRGSVIQVCR